MPFKEGGRYFYSRNDGLQNQSVLYTMKTLADVPRLLLDPNTLAADGTVALAGLAVSPNGKYLAYSTAASGSDWNEIKVRDIDSGKDIEDHIKWGEVLQHRMAARRFRLLLQPLRRTEGSDQAGRRELLPEAVLPQDRHAAKRGHPGLPTARTTRTGASAAKSRKDGRFLIITGVARHGEQEPRLLQRPVAQGRQGGAAARRFRRFV